MADVTAARMAVLEEHLKAESEHDMEALMAGFTADCFNDMGSMARRFVGPKRVAERYRAMWDGFPDFRVRIKRILAADAACVVSENQWTGTHLGTFQGIPPTGRRVRVRSLVVWHFRGDELWGETVFFDVGSIARQVGAEIVVKKAAGVKGAKRAKSGKSAKGAKGAKTAKRAKGAKAAKAAESAKSAKGAKAARGGKKATAGRAGKKR